MNYEETLSTLKAIQASYAPVPFLANSETEPRFVIDSDTREIIIPEEFKFLAVKMDHMSEKIYFEIPRYFDDEDLATKICVVQYINTNGDAPIEAIVAAVDVDTESEFGKIIFRWDVDNYLTRYAGMVSFAVRFYTISDDNRFTYSWNTLPATLPVLDTLDNTNDTVSQNYPTELVQWQFRMSELDRTISGKIAEATESIDTNTKAAQEARKGAEDAEARVNAIVAGNEAYTKQQSHDLFALALRGTAEAAKSITIYPDKGSNVVVTVNGFTKQAGTGDPSLTNIRQLTNGGLKLVEFALTGDESVGTYKDFAFSFFSDKPIAEWAGAYAQAGGKWSSEYKPVARDSISALTAQNHSFSASMVLNRDGTEFFVVASEFGQNTEAFKAHLKERYNSGNPIKFWYRPASESDATGLYAPLTGTGDGRTVACGELTSPLCQGDTLITKVKSGCDCIAVFDGSDDENWQLDSTYGKRYQIFGRLSPQVVAYSKVYTNQYNAVAYIPTWITYDYNKPLVAVDKHNAYIIWNGIESVDELKSMLKKKPLVIYYKSSGYTDADDISVSLEMHQKGITVLDGTEPGSINPGGGYISIPLTTKKMPLVAKGAGDSGLSSIAKASYVSSGGGFYWPANSRNVIFGKTYADQFENYEAFQAKLAKLYAAGTPAQFVYPLSAPITYAHDPIDFIASPDEEGAWVITGEADGTVSAEYNKNITKALEDILTRVSALELHALGG